MYFVRLTIIIFIKITTGNDVVEAPGYLEYSNTILCHSLSITMEIMHEVGLYKLE
jgi:hypothetical protein